MNSVAPNIETEAEKVERLQRDILRKMSFAQKWEMAWNLRETAWQLKASYLRSRHPDWSAVDVQDAVRKQFLYGST